MTEVPGIAGWAVQCPAVDHDSRAYSGRHHDTHEAPGTPPGTKPVLAQCHRDRVVVQAYDDAGEPRLDPRDQREPPPCRNVDRRHLATVQPQRTAAPDADRVRDVSVQHLIQQSDHRRPKLLGFTGRRCGGRYFASPDDRTCPVHERCSELGAPDVEREHGGLVHPDSLHPHVAVRRRNVRR